MTNQPDTPNKQNVSMPPVVASAIQKSNIPENDQAILAKLNIPSAPKFFTQQVIANATPQSTSETLLRSAAPVANSFPTETLELPTKGWFYPSESPLSSGILEFKQMTAVEEDILTSQKLIKNGTAVSEVIKRLIVTPGVDVNDILICDLNTIVVFVRRLAYGDSYGPLTYTCPECSTKSQDTINLSKFDNKEVDFTRFPKGVNSFEFLFPYSKRKITFKLLTERDNKAMNDELTALSKITKSGVSANITTKLKYQITSVDGDSNREYINRFVSTEMLSRDSSELRAYISGITPDIDMSFNFICPSCGTENNMEVPLTAEFFWPNY